MALGIVLAHDQSEAPLGAYTEARLSVEQSILIVDQSAESREVLRAALERGGTRILEAAGPERGLEMARSLHPDVIVLDVEVDALDAESVTDDFWEAARASNTPIVVLASARSQAGGLSGGEFVAKPYHYAPLIRKIEALLGRSA